MSCRSCRPLAPALSTCVVCRATIRFVCRLGSNWKRPAVRLIADVLGTSIAAVRLLKRAWLSSRLRSSAIVVAGAESHVVVGLAIDVRHVELVAADLEAGPPGHGLGAHDRPRVHGLGLEVARQEIVGDVVAQRVRALYICASRSAPGLGAWYCPEGRTFSAVLAVSGACAPAEDGMATRLPASAAAIRREARPTSMRAGPYHPPACARPARTSRAAICRGSTGSCSPAASAATSSSARARRSCGRRTN